MGTINIEASQNDPIIDGALTNRGRNTLGGVNLIGNAQSKFRDEFATFDTDNTWDVISTGAGMAITLAGTTTKYLNIATGVTINSETIIRSKEAFTMPFRAALGLTMSQRIANQEVYLEFVGCDGFGNVEAGTASAFSNGYKNYAGMRFDGTSATVMAAAVRGMDAPEVVSTGITTTTTVATGTDPNFISAAMYEILPNMISTLFSDAGIDSTFYLNIRKNFTQATPDPDKLYKLQIRVKNLGTAPASSTNVRIHFARVTDFTRHQVEITGGMGHSSGAYAVPVAFAGTQTAYVQGAAAEDAAASTYPALVGGVARTTPMTAVASGDVVRNTMSTDGSQIVKPFAVPDQDWQYPAGAGGITNTTDVAVKAAAGSGIRNYVTAIQLRNTNAVATEFVIKDGATVMWRTQLPASMTDMFEVNFPTPLKGTANTAVNVACVTTGAAVYANLQGFVGR